MEARSLTNKLNVSGVQVGDVKLNVFAVKHEGKENVGFNIYTVHGTHIGQQIELHNNYYEYPLLNHLKENYDVTHVVDVGANIGNHSLFFAREMNANVIAFECNPDCFDCLQRNINIVGYSENGSLPTVRLIKKAAADSVRAFVNHNPRLNRKDKIMLGCNEIRYDSSSEDKTTTLDMELLQNKDIDLIKIDVEGKEESVIRGAVNTLLTHQPVLVIETNHPDKIVELIKELTDLDYKYGAKFCATPTYIFEMIKKSI